MLQYEEATKKPSYFRSILISQMSIIFINNMDHLTQCQRKTINPKLSPAVLVCQGDLKKAASFIWIIHIYLKTKCACMTHWNVCFKFSTFSISISLIQLIYLSHLAISLITAAVSKPSDAATHLILSIGQGVQLCILRHLLG